MADLIPPHGGLKEPVNCTVACRRDRRFQAEAASLTKVPVSDADLSTVYRFGDGALSPLTGPMDSAAYNRVLDESVDRARRQALRLDDSARVAGDEGAGRPVEGRPERGAGEFGRRDRRDARHQRRLRVGQAAVHQERLPDRAHRSSRRRHGAQGRRRQDAPARRHDPRAAAAEASEVRQVRALAARGPQAAGRARAGTASSPSRPAIRCTGPTNTRWSTAWKRCSGPGTTPAPASIR